MRMNAILLTTIAAWALVAPPAQSFRFAWSLAAAAAQTQGINFASPAAPLVAIVAREPRWRREGGFLIADVTLDNRSESPVHNVILTCDFFDSGGLALATRGSLIQQPLLPGSTTIEGIEFTMFKDNVLDRGMRGGTCGVTAAEHLSAGGESAIR